MSRLLLVRHGETILHSSRRFWGHTDVELSDEGINQVKRLRDYLSTQTINAAYSSTLKRALLTAKTITARRQLQITACPELIEISFGLIEGLTFDEIKEQHAELAEQMSAWKVLPAFPSGESLAELDLRVKKFLPLLEKHAPNETILIVSHAGVLRTMLCNLLGLGLEHWRKLHIDLASLSIVDTYDGVAILKRLNDTSYLE